MTGSLYKFANQAGAAAKLTAPLAAGTGATSCTVDSIANFPTLLSGQVCVGIIQDTPASDIEVILIEAISGLNLTIARGQEGTTAEQHATGATLAAVITKALWDLIFPASGIVDAPGVINLTPTSRLQALGPQTSPGAVTVNLPADAIPGLGYPIGDVGQDFSVNPVSVNPPAGGTIFLMGGSNPYPMDIRGMYLEFYSPDGGTTWGIR